MLKYFRDLIKKKKPKPTTSTSYFCTKKASTYGSKIIVLHLFINLATECHLHDDKFLETHKILLNDSRAVKSFASTFKFSLC